MKRIALILAALVASAWAQQPVSPAVGSIFEVSPGTVVNSATNPFYHANTDGTNPMGAMANFGTSPTAVKALNVNASIFAGTTALVPNTWGTATTGAGYNVNASLAIGASMVSATVPVPISATAAANTNSNPLFVAQQTTGGNPCQNPAATLASVTASTSGTSAVQLIALSGSTKVYICSLTVVGVSGTSPTFSLEYGTGTACATGATVFLGAFATTAAVAYPFANPVYLTPAGQAVCYLDGGTTPVQRVMITYVQQ